MPQLSSDPELEKMEGRGKKGVSPPSCAVCTANPWCKSLSVSLINEFSIGNNLDLVLAGFPNLAPLALMHIKNPSKLLPTTTTVVSRIVESDNKAI